MPAGTGAGFVTGATAANFSGLAAARHAVLKQAGWDVEADGLFGAPEVTVVVGDGDFFALCREYIAGHRSSSYNLSDYGRELPAFLAEKNGLPEFLGELAAFELLVHLF